MNEKISDCIKETLADELCMLSVTFVDLLTKNVIQSLEKKCEEEGIVIIQTTDLEGML